MAKKNLSGWICKLLGCGETKKRMVRFGWAVEPPKLKGKIRMPLELTVTNEEQVKVHLAPVTAAGKPTKLDGKPAWTVVSGPAKVVPADDGLSADLVSDDTDLSDTTFMVDADADLGSGVEDIQDTILLHVSHANAKNLGLSADAPVLKP
jgi:hypothetical protein